MSEEKEDLNDPLGGLIKAALDQSEEEFEYVPKPSPELQGIWARLAAERGTTDTKEEAIAKKPEELSGEKDNKSNLLCI